MSKRKYPAFFKKDVLKGRFTTNDIDIDNGCHGWDNTDINMYNIKTIKCSGLACVDCKLSANKNRSEKIKNKMNKWIMNKWLESQHQCEQGKPNV